MKTTFLQPWRQQQQQHQLLCHLPLLCHKRLVRPKCLKDKPRCHLVQRYHTKREGENMLESRCEITEIVMVKMFLLDIVLLYLRVK